MLNKAIDISASHHTEKDARIELAAFYRLVEYLGWGEGIYNHIALRVPGEPTKFLIKPHALTYEEVTASSLVKVDYQDDLDESAGVNKVGFTTHAPVMRARSDVSCSAHFHTVPVMAIAAHPKGLRMVGQHALRFYGSISYQEYQGFVENVDEQQRIIDGLGGNRALILRNHGALVVGTSAEDTFTSMLRLVAACEVQLALEAAGQGLVEIPPEQCEHSVRQIASHDTGRGGADWPAWLRRMDRMDPSFRE